MKRRMTTVAVLVGSAVLLAPMIGAEEKQSEPVVPTEKMMLWNSKDDWIVVIVNGVLQNVATRCSESFGKICLQSEGIPIEYRNVYIEPLE
jgi:hypothetical protein